MDPIRYRKRRRSLTAAEIAEARSVFGDAIDYQSVRICDDRYVFCQLRHWVMAPDGCIYWPGAPADLVRDSAGACTGTFIHEMTHVWQYQRGLNVLGRGFVLHAARLLSFGFYDPYRVRYRPERPFTDYNIEQQAQLAVMIWGGLVPNIIPGGTSHRRQRRRRHPTWRRASRTL